MRSTWTAPVFLFFFLFATHKRFGKGATPVSFLICSCFLFENRQALPLCGDWAREIAVIRIDVTLDEICVPGDRFGVRTVFENQDEGKVDFGQYLSSVIRGMGPASPR